MTQVRLDLAESSNIEQAHFDADAREVTVRFKNGAEWKYYDFTEEHARAWLTAGSVGSHFSKEIRGKHRGAKVDQEISL